MATLAIRTADGEIERYWDDGDAEVLWLTLADGATRIDHLRAILHDHDGDLSAMDEMDLLPGALVDESARALLLAGELTGDFPTVGRNPATKERIALSYPPGFLELTDEGVTSATIAAFYQARFPGWRVEHTHDAEALRARFEQIGA